MELGESTQAGLALLGEERHFSQQQLVDFVQMTIRALIADKRTDIDAFLAVKSLETVNQGMLKEAYAALMTLFLEASRANADAAAVTTALEDSKVTGNRATTIAKMYSESLQKERIALSTTAFNYPHVTDVSWRLDYYLKDDQLEKVNAPVYLVEFATEANDGQKGTVQLSLSIEQLQDVVNRLKDASRALQVMTQTA